MTARRSLGLVAALGLAACTSSGGAGAPGAGGEAAGAGGGGETAGAGGGTAAAGSGGGGTLGGGGRGGAVAGSGGAGAGGRGGVPAAGNGGAAGAGGRGGGLAGGGAGAGGKGGAVVSSGGAGTGGGAAGSAGAAAGALIRNDVFWKDTSGNVLYSQGGGVLKVGATYYWYGVKYNGAVTYAANPTKLNDDSSFNAVTCYSSTDLASWKFEANVLTAASVTTGIGAADWIGRMGVVYNANTKKYVLVTQYQGTAGAGELFATSDTPTGPFTVDHLQAVVTNVANMTTGDQTLFVDDDGKAYLICSSSMGRSNLYVAPLRASDSLNVEPATRIFGGAGREGNAMFKYNGHYYFCSSDLHGWNASHAYYIQATSIMGPYSAEGIIENTDADFGHVTQTGLFVTVVGARGTTVIFAGDRWSDFAGNGLGYNQWCPLTFNGVVPQLRSLSEWSLNAADGTWSVGAGNNYALNPGFEADRVAMTVPAGWTTTTNLTGVSPFGNVSSGRTGRFNWQLTHTAAFQASLDQTVADLPSGTYTLAAWVKSSGGQSVAELYASVPGGARKAADLSAAMASWTQLSVSGVAVTGGQLQIGVTTTSAANQRLNLDDFTLTRTGP